MKICFCANHQSTHAIGWAKELSHREGLVVYLITDGKVRLDRSRDPVTVVRLRKVTYGNLLTNLIQLRRAVQKIRPDIVHAFYSTNFGLLSVLAKRENVVVTVQGSDIFIEPKRSRVFSLINWFVFKRATGIHLVASHMKGEMRKYEVPPEKLSVFPEGVDTRTFKSAKRPENERLSMISTRRLKENYRNDVLIQAAFRLKQAGKRFSLVMVGEGPERENLETLSRQLGIQKDVRFVGFVDRTKICSYLQKNMYYISTSPSDGASASLLEAMACGAYPIVTDIEANREFIIQGETGFLFRKNDPSSLADFILEIHGNRNLFRSAAKKNRMRIEQDYSTDRTLRKLMRVYNRMRSA